MFWFCANFRNSNLVMEIGWYVGTQNLISPEMEGSWSNIPWKLSSNKSRHFLTGKSLINVGDVIRLRRADNDMAPKINGRRERLSCCLASSIEDRKAGEMFICRRCRFQLDLAKTSFS